MMTRGLDYTRRKINELRSKPALTAKEEDLLVTMEAVYEFNLRGFEFAPMSLYESDATKFLIRDGKLLPPFVAISGLGESAAWNLAAGVSSCRSRSSRPPARRSARRTWSSCAIWARSARCRTAAR